MLAIGTFTPRRRQSPASPSTTPHPTSRNPCAPYALAGFDAASPLLLVGTGLTTVDMAIFLLDWGHAGPLRLGLDVTATCALLNREGGISRRLFVVGPGTKGAFWEMTAMPDIRRQCELLAQHLATLVKATPVSAPKADAPAVA